MTDLICPRCSHDILVLNLQVFASFTFTAGVRTATSLDDDGEGFLSLTCDACHLTLSGAPGDGRLRRAAMVDSETGDELDREDEVVAVYEVRMVEMAEALSRIAAAV